MSTKTTYELRFTNGGEPTHAERERITERYNAWMEAVDDSSSDEESLTASELIDELLGFASIEIDDVEVEQCDECDEEADMIWPKLNPPVALCASCEHNARRSGWEPGQ